MTKCKLSADSGAIAVQQLAQSVEKLLLTS